MTGRGGSSQRWPRTYYEGQCGRCDATYALLCQPVTNVSTGPKWHRLTCEACGSQVILDRRRQKAGS
ncbi:hypothetical protein QUV83_17605 [Cellulomonas cellasea]|uniref:hypothetical protein n=1 Tax=Cellulomonas cellasea TaxID=43670 RepID=UPI0025A49BB1|nr:hypothetical protein [Cellulomonas cellasea]MDM8086591.1 hypothetical protein [Cellulomonas cellasea]